MRYASRLAALKDLSFPIPMRGNEVASLDSRDGDRLAAFPIPMRGNEIVVWRLRSGRRRRVSNPHEG